MKDQKRSLTAFGEGGDSLEVDVGSIPLWRRLKSVMTEGEGASNIRQEQCVGEVR